MRKAIANALAKNVVTKSKSKNEIPLFFDEIKFSEKFAELFEIADKERFETAFNSVTQGVGGEIKKINSVESSSLLCLLTFFPLYSGKAKLSVVLPEVGKVTFDKCLFEVRNKVIGLPSCIDVVLRSEDGSILLFLESKLSEFEEITKQKSYGISYHDLYVQLQDMLCAVKFRETKNEKEDKMTLSSDEAVYIEGIKQCISHLIGIVKGPQKKKDLTYDSTEYESAYDKAKHLFYGTILFNPEAIGVQSKAFASYSHLYKQFASTSEPTLQAIRKWADKSDMKKPIAVLPEVLTYQDFFPKEYFDTVPKVRDFYKLHK